MERISGWTIFTLKGVAVKVHVSLLFLLLYVIMVATASFPFVVETSGIDRNQLTGSPLIWALIFCASLIVSIFLHEFSHVLVAQAKGFRVRDITLMMLGGVSQMEKLPEEPASEFKVAIIGPIVSLVIAGLLFWMRSVTTSADLAFFGFWVGRTNLVLGIFNLLPAFPTDGGRILRAFLVTRLGRLRGTQIAVQVSHVFAWIFGIIGFFQFNVLLVLIAFFIYAASKSELFMLWGQTILKNMKAKDIMTPISGISATDTLSQAVKEMKTSKHLLLPVNADGNRAIISHENIKAVPKSLWNETLVRDIAVQIPKAIDANDSLDEVWQIALSSSAGGVPITQNHQLVGIIKTLDLIEAFELKQLTAESYSAAPSPWSLKTRHEHQV